MIISWAWKNRGAIYEKRKNVHCEKNDQSFTLKQAEWLAKQKTLFLWQQDTFLQLMQKIKQIHTKGPFLHPLQTLENIFWRSRGYRNGTLVWNELN